MNDDEVRAAAEIIYQGLTGTPIPPYLREEFHEGVLEARRDTQRWMETPNPDPELEQIRQALLTQRETS